MPDEGLALHQRQIEMGVSRASVAAWRTGYADSPRLRRCGQRNPVAIRDRLYLDHQRGVELSRVQNLKTEAGDGGILVNATCGYTGDLNQTKLGQVAEDQVKPVADRARNGAQQVRIVLHIDGEDPNRS